MIFCYPDSWKGAPRVVITPYFLSSTVISLSRFSFLERNITVIEPVIYTVSGKLAYSSGLIHREGISTEGSSLRRCSSLERGSLRISSAFKDDEFGILPFNNSSFSSLLYGRTDVTLKSITLLLTCTL